MTDRVESAERADSFAAEKLREASTKVRDTTELARQTVAEVYAAARERATTAIEAARVRTAETRDRAGNMIDTNPVAAVAGGLALGALIGVLLPRTQKESEYLGGVGERITGTAKDAASAAKEAGRNTLGDLGLNGDSLREQVNTLIDSAIKAFGSATEAVSGTLKK